MKRFYLFIFISLASVGAVFCQDYPFSSNYWPVADPSAKWLYYNNFFNGEICNSGSGSTDHRYLVIKGTWGDSSCCNPFHVNFPGPTPVDHYTWMKFHDHDIYLTYLGAGSRHIVNFSAAVGDSFYTDDPYNPYIKCLSRDSTVTVPAGTFEHCFVFDNGAAWAPGVGLVNELVAYHINGEWHGQIPNQIDAEIVMPSETMLFPNSPNPFNASTEIRFSLAHACGIELMVDDLLGRRVKIIMQSFLPQGIHRVRWDGSDDLGRTVPSGAYFIHLQAGSQRKTIKALVAR